MFADSPSVAVPPFDVAAAAAPKGIASLAQLADHFSWQLRLAPVAQSVQNLAGVGRAEGTFPE